MSDLKGAMGQVLGHGCYTQEVPIEAVVPDELGRLLPSSRALQFLKCL